MNDVRGYLSTKGIDFTVRGDEAVANCPFCDDKEHKFAMNLDTGVYNCKHVNKCGVKGTFWDFKRRMGDVSEFRYTPKVYIKPVPVLGAANERLLDWFRGRGIHAQTVAKFHVTQKDGAMVFPYTKGGEVVNQKYRTVDKKFWQEKQAEQTLYGRDLLWPELKELVIVEGEIDAMSLVQLGIEHTVSVPSGASNQDWIESEYAWLERFDKIYLGLDSDAAGEAGADAIAARLGRWRCYRVRWPLKDANDCLKAGMGKDALMECIMKAEDMGPKDVRKAEEFFDAILQADLEGVKSGFHNFDTILGGFRPQEVTLWTGRNGDGKTTILGQVVMAFLVRQYKVCIGSFEMRPKQYLRWMMRQARLSINEAGIKKFGEITAGNLALLDVQDEITPDDLMTAFEYAAKRIGCRMFIIDSLLRVNLSGQDWLEKQRDFMNRLTQFVQTYEAHVHLVAHPRKGSADKDKIDKVDIAGSYDLSNIASNVISMRRIDREVDKCSYDAALTVLKNRETGKLGMVPLMFDEEYKYFSEVRG
jgi:twinkle protein